MNRREFNTAFTGLSVGLTKVRMKPKDASKPWTVRWSKEVAEEGVSHYHSSERIPEYRDYKARLLMIGADFLSFFASGNDLSRVVAERDFTTYEEAMEYRHQLIFGKLPESTVVDVVIFNNGAF